MQSYTTDDGFTLRVFSTMYLDWGLEILDPNGETVYYNPHCICSEYVGFNDEDEDGNILDEGVAWTDEEWVEYLKWEADSLIECFVEEAL